MSGIAFDQTFINALVEGFAALGSVVGFVSAAAAFLAAYNGESSEGVGVALNEGIVMGFLPGALVAATVIASAWGVGI